MDELRIGRALRALRLRRRLRQADVAAKAGLSRSQYGRIERGELRGVPLDDIVAACAALGADLDVRVRWHGEGLDRLLDAGHAKLVDMTVERLRRLGWTVAVEVTFNHFGERGSVDVLGWKAEHQALLVVEVKSVVPDSQAMLSAHDRKFRLGGVIAAERGWQPRVVGKLLIVGEGSTSRRRVRALEAMFASAYPDRARVVEGWLRRPEGPLAGAHLPITCPSGWHETSGGDAVGRREATPRLNRRPEPPPSEVLVISSNAGSRPGRSGAQRDGKWGRCRDLAPEGTAAIGYGALGENLASGSGTIEGEPRTSPGLTSFDPPERLCHTPAALAGGAPRTRAHHPRPAPARWAPTPVRGDETNSPRR